MIAQITSTKIFICFMFGLLGFLGNWFKVALFLNVDFLTGSFFVILAILMLGGVYGVIVGFIAATCTYFLWNHPYAIIIMTGEALFVALMYVRRKGNVVVYDMIYWLIIGIPLIYIFYHHVMALQMQSTLLLILKLSINGIFNSLMAIILYALISQWRRIPEPIGYSQLIFTVMVSLVLVPAMLLFTITIRDNLQDEQHAFTVQSTQTAEKVRDYLASYIKERQNTIQTLSALVRDPDTAKFSDMQHYVELLKATVPDFWRMGVLNKDSKTVAYSPLEVDGKSTLGVDYSDRPYISIMKEKKQPYIPDVVMGKLGKPIPIALLLATIVVGGEYKGYAAGVIDVAKFSAIFTNFLVDKGISSITLVDGNYKVIASTITDMRITDQFLRSYSINRKIESDQTFHWIPEPLPGISVIQRWMNSLLVNIMSLSPNYGWKLIVEVPMLPLVQNIFQFSIYGLGLLWIWTIFTVILSYFFSRGFVFTIARLQDITNLLPQQLVDGGQITWPESNIMELEALGTNFREMANALAASFQEQQIINEALRRSKEVVEVVSRTKSEFLVNMTHEMRTPLNSVIGFSQVLEGGAYGELNEKQLTFLANIRNSGQHLLTMLTDILELAAVEFGEMRFHPSTFAIADLLKATLGRFNTEAKTRQLTLTLEPGTDDLMVEADLEMLKKVFAHLVGNAVKFTPDGGKITIQSQAAPGAQLLERGPTALTADLLPEQDYLLVTVADTGIGIKEDDFPKLFTKFTQLENPYTKKYGGIGLGLALVKALVERHHGKVGVESRLDEGSRFTVVLPVRQPKELTGIISGHERTL